jgi:hypothetical protein
LPQLRFSASSPPRTSALCADRACVRCRRLSGVQYRPETRAGLTCTDHRAPPIRQQRGSAPRRPSAAATERPEGPGFPRMRAHANLPPQARSAAPLSCPGRSLGHIRTGPPSRHKRASGACRSVANASVKAVAGAGSRSRSQRAAEDRRRDQTGAAPIAQIRARRRPPERRRPPGHAVAAA